MEKKIPYSCCQLYYSLRFKGSKWSHYPTWDTYKNKWPIIIRKYWHKPAQVERYTPLGPKLHDCKNYFYDVNQCVSCAHLYNVLVKMYFMNE